jgi:L-lactate dehydrogenase complex protein LldG
MVGAAVMMDPDRAAILERITKALAGHEPLAQPQWTLPEGGDEDRVSLAERFRCELELVGGEARFVASEEELADAIAAFVSERKLGPASVDYPTADYALLRAEALVADTGSAIVIERSAQRRLAPYLPRTCVIVGDASNLYPSMTAGALAAVHAAARRGDRGEAVIITGPSKTADIEKTLVLGAHGPKHLVVFVVGVEP